MPTHSHHETATPNRSNAEEWRRAEEPRSSHDGQFRATLELAPLGIAHVGLDGQWLWANQKLCDILGYSHDQLARLTFQDVTRPEDLAEELANRHAALEGRISSYAMQKRYIRQDGATIWAHLTVSLARTSAGDPDYFIYVVEDISDRRRLDLAITRAQQADGTQAREFEAIIEAIADGVSIYDAAGRLQRINTAGRALLGSDNIIAYFERAHPSRALDQEAGGAQGNVTPQRDWPLNRVLRGETISSADAVELAATGPDGRARVLSFTGAPIRDANGKITRALIAYRDMTERRLADHERDQMLNIVSHELRTPLTAMKARAQMMRRHQQRGADVTVKQFEQLGHDVERLERLVNDLNEASRTQQGTVELILEQCDLRALCQQVASEQMETTGRVITLDLPRKPLETAVDCSRIEQVLANLVNNAMKYSPPDTPVSITLRRCGGKVKISVRDEGPGIAPDALAHIFERFYRAPDAQVLSGPATSLGLGLYICKTLVEQHGGQIGVESKPGRGSTFWFTLPLRDLLPSLAAHGEEP